MTAPQPATPGSDSVRAALVAELDTFLGQWRTAGAIPFELAGIVDRFRPAAPSEPPAADSPTPGTEVAGEHTVYPCRCGAAPGIHLHKRTRHFIAPSPVDTTEPPAETQQDDELRNSYRAAEITNSVPLRRVITAALDEAEARGRSLAARPSADTETLRDVLLKHHPIAHTMTGPLKGCRCGQVRLGEDVIAHVADELLAVLGGPQPDGEAGRG